MQYRLISTIVLGFCRELRSEENGMEKLAG
jgi:hypothetical protein